jgi:hypothetical protein
MFEFAAMKLKSYRPIQPLRGLENIDVVLVRRIRMKTKEEALAMAVIIDDEAQNLPDRNFFGEDNTEAKEESYAWVAALKEYASTGIVPDDDESVEVRYWITGEGWSPLEDYT